MSISANDSATFLKTVPFLSGLDDTDYAQLSQISHTKSFKKGETLFVRGDHASEVFLVMSGWVKTYRDTLEGDEAVVGVFSHGDMFAETALLAEGEYPYSAQAVEDTVVTALPAASLKLFVAKRPDIMLKIMQSFSQHMNRLQLENEHLSFMSASQRVGCLLLQIAADHKDGERAILRFPYEKALAASKLGMKPETFSRALSQLKEIGVAVKHDIIEIGSYEDLIEHVCSNCSAGFAGCAYADKHNCSDEERANCAAHKITNGRART
ncbi:MAG: Crp/Fnr family transcriptional regulator [Pseudobdellovibrionaceae bacterium]